ncbi:MAG: succinyl-diaminopimelate desuccinylase [Pseudomonadota bacterium]
MTPKDPVALTRALIQCPSVTPDEAGALQLLEAELSDAGFTCWRADRGGIANLLARWGDKAHPKTLGFNGHTDVVPVGDKAAWTHPPFSAEIVGGEIYGRGATDMKSGVAAFVAAAIDHVQNAPPEGAILIAITGDEEGDALDGTTALLADMEAKGEAMSHCLVGEPTCPDTLGDMMKIGRRGSMSAWITMKGVQGHSAYLHRAKNPIPPLMRLLDQLSSEPLDQGTEHFDPSTLAVVTVDVGNPTTNVIPAEAKACLNIRFNDLHSGESLSQMLRTRLADIASKFDVTGEMTIKISGEAFLTPPGDFSKLVASAVTAETGLTPELSTSGGTSDARFIKDHCPVVEFGLVGKTMHQVDERVEIAQIKQLKAIYARIIAAYFA